MINDDEVLRQQFAAEVIRFVHARIPAKQRPGTAWVFAVLEIANPNGPLIVSTFDDSTLTAELLEHLAARVRGTVCALLRPAPEAS